MRPLHLIKTLLAGGTILLLVVVGLCLSACTSYGPKKIPADRFNYNEAIASSWREQMLLNLVRLRYDHVPTFLHVGSVLTQYVYTGNLGAQGTVGTDRADSTALFRGSVGLSYTERPTITFTPVSSSSGTCSPRFPWRFRSRWVRPPGRPIC